LVLASHYIK